MVIFDNIRLNGADYTMQELKFSQALGLSSLNNKQAEQQLNEFLGHVLEHQVEDIKMLNVKERYYFLLKYLAKHTSNLLGIDVDYYQYIPKHEPLFNIETVDSYILEHEQIRQLTGYDMELLEQLGLLNAKEWLSSAFALQYSNEHITALAEPLDPRDDDYAEKFEQRLSYLNGLPISEYDDLYSNYLELLNYLDEIDGLKINFVFSDSGLVLTALDNQGGTALKPCRFCCSSAFGRFFESMV